MKKPTIQQLAGILSARYEGPNPSLEITGVNGLELAGPNEASFLANPRYREAMKTSQAGVICVDEATKRHSHQNYLISADPSRTFQCLVEHLFSSYDNKTEFSNIHPTAVIHPSAKIAEGVEIGPNSVIDGHVVIGKNTRIAANVTIMRNVVIGENCLIYPGCTVRERSVLKNRVILQPGAVIGSCGFGYTTDAKGNHTKLEQVGNVVLEDDVEIGANSTIDRARFKTTLIKSGTKIDNLVQIAHNAEIGHNNIVAAQTGISGSTKTGNVVMFGGQCGVIGHLDIADGALFASRSGVSKSVNSPGKYRGSPAKPIEQYNREKVHVRKLDGYVKQIKELQKQIEEIQRKLSS